MPKTSEPVIHSDLEILGRTPVFVGTRVPAQSLFDYLEAGDDLALLDESLPRGLARLLSDHEVTTVPEAGWAGLQNGELLEGASENYDAVVTIDANLPYQ